MQKYSCKKLFLYLAVIMCSLHQTSALASANTHDIPLPFSEALSMYKKNGMKDFITTLVKDSPLDGRQEISVKLSILEKIEKHFGNYQSFDILHVNTLSDSTRLIYFLLNYEKGPVFGRLTAFKQIDREIIVAFEFHTKAEKIFPDGLLFGI